MGREACSALPHANVVTRIAEWRLALNTEHEGLLTTLTPHNRQPGALQGFAPPRMALTVRPQAGATRDTRGTALIGSAFATIGAEALRFPLAIDFLSPRRIGKSA
jgi:hypothetical protein